MTLQGRVNNGVIVLTSGLTLPEGTLVNVMPAEEVAAIPAGQEGPYPVSTEQKAALLGLIGLWKVENPPGDDDVERMIEEYRMKKYG